MLIILNAQVDLSSLYKMELKTICIFLGMKSGVICKDAILISSLICLAKKITIGRQVSVLLASWVLDTLEMSLCRKR